MIVTSPSPPSPTPAPTLASAYGLFDLKPRQTIGLDYTFDAGCLDVYDGLQCTTILNGCYSDFMDNTDYDAAATSCFCNYGISYLDCFYSQVATGTCATYHFGTDGYGDYQRSFLMDYCGTIPPDAMAFIQAPTSVELTFETFDVVTATGALPKPSYNGQPIYEGSGELLKGACAETAFTLVDAGSTVYYAGFQGCVKDRPGCCPWAVDTTVTAPSGAAATGGANVKEKAYEFPIPVDEKLGKLASCADDYYSISGGCCPNGFWPFTREVGGITPCWSSVNSIEPDTLTVELEGTTKDKPTSAVVNIVWSMRYEVAEPGGGGLSTAAKAGIGAGAGVAAILIAGLAICLWRSRRKNKKLAASQAVPPPQAQPQQQQPPFQQPQMMQQAPPPNSQYPPGAYPPGMLAAGNMLPPSDRASIATSTTPVSPLALAPQSTGTSNGHVSELSSQSDQQLLHNNNGQPGGGYFPGAAAAANPRVSYGSSNGAGSPSVGPNGQGYPAPIAEADEGHVQYLQYGYQQQQYQPQQPQQQQQQQYYYAAPMQQMAHQGQGQGQYYPPQTQGGHAYPQQQQGFSQNVPEMSAHKEADPPQEVMGSQVQRPMQG